MEYSFAAAPVYAESHSRRNIFFSQVIEALIGSSFHEEHGRQTVMAFADLSVLVATLREETIHSLLDHLDLDGLSCFHRRPMYQPLQDLQALFRKYFKYFSSLFWAGWHQSCSILIPVWNSPVY